MATINPHINFNGNAEVAFIFYKSAFGGEFAKVMRFKDVAISGPSEGVGAKASWNGKQMGVGSSEVIESIANQVVKTKLEYTKPFEMAQLAEISLTPTTGGALVKWSVSGHKNYVFRLMGIFMNCDTMIGGEFDKGLNKLKRLAENK